MSEFNKLYSEFLFKTLSNECGFRKKTKFFLDIEIDEELPPSDNLAYLLLATLQYEATASNFCTFFYKKYSEMSNLKEEASNFEEELMCVDKELDNLVNQIRRTILIKYNNEHYTIGNVGPSIYLIYEKDLWYLGKIAYTNKDTSQIIQQNMNDITEYDDLPALEKDTATQTIDVFCVVKDQITNIIGKIDVLKEMAENYRNQLILSLTSSTFSIITSITTLSIEEMGKISKILNCANIACSLTTLVHGIYASIRFYDSNFNVKQALKVIPSAVEIFEQQINMISNDSREVLLFIKPAITAITAVIIGGLNVFGVCDAKAIIQASNFSKAYKEITTDANDIVNFLIEDICQIDINGDKILHKELIDLALEAGELSITPVFKFCTNQDLKNSLLTFQTRYQKAAGTRFKDVINSKAAMSAKTTINGLLSQIIGLIKAVKDVAEQCGRQETLAIMLAGQPGIGKSSLIKPLQKYISEKLGYKNESYDLTKETPDKFYTTYGGQPYGVVNEFMGTSLRNDGFLKSFNKIVSGDHVNLEGSSLEQKYQPADFKVVFLTSNDLCPNLIGDDGLKPETARAVWSRTLRILVEDKEFKGRMGKNTHRKADGSHLTFKIVPLEIQEETNLANITPKLQNISFNELKDMIVEQLVKREFNYLSNIQIPEVGGNPLITNFEDNEQIEKRKRLLESMMLTANAPNIGKEFFCIRMQGNAGVGKSRLAGILSDIVSKFRQIPVRCVSDFKRDSNEEEGVYIIDDILYTKIDKIRYLEWINKGNRNNLYIICSNTVYKLKDEGLLKNIVSRITGKMESQYYMIHDHEPIIPSGYYRRIGLSGSVLISEHQPILQNSSRNNLTILTIMETYV